MEAWTGNYVGRFLVALTAFRINQQVRLAQMTKQRFAEALLVLAPGHCLGFRQVQPEDLSGRAPVVFAHNTPRPVWTPAGCGCRPRRRRSPNQRRRRFGRSARRRHPHKRIAGNSIKSSARPRNETWHPSRKNSPIHHKRTRRPGATRPGHVVVVVVGQMSQDRAPGPIRRAAVKGLVQAHASKMGRWGGSASRTTTSLPRTCLQRPVRVLPCSR